jgi:hypothetical protein
MAGLDLQAPALNLQGPNVPDEIANTPAVLVGSVTLGPTGLHVTDLLATVGPDTTLQLDGHLDLAMCPTWANCNPCCPTCAGSGETWT